jgi:hypothetical protein
MPVMVDCQQCGKTMPRDAVTHGCSGKHGDVVTARVAVGVDVSAIHYMSGFQDLLEVFDDQRPARRRRGRPDYAAFTASVASGCRARGESPTAASA